MTNRRNNMITERYESEWDGYQWVAVDRITREEIPGTRALSASGALSKAEDYGRLPADYR